MLALLRQLLLEHGEINSGQQQAQVNQVSNLSSAACLWDPDQVTEPLLASFSSTVDGEATTFLAVVDRMCVEYLEHSRFSINEHFLSNSDPITASPQLQCCNCSSMASVVPNSQGVIASKPFHVIRPWCALTRCHLPQSERGQSSLITEQTYCCLFSVSALLPTASWRSQNLYAYPNLPFLFLKKQNKTKSPKVSGRNDTTLYMTLIQWHLNLIYYYK